MNLVQKTQFDEGKIVKLRLNNPKARNALSLAVLKSLKAHFESISKSDAEVVLICAFPDSPVFSSGHNLKEICAIQTNYLEEISSAPNAPTAGKREKAIQQATEQAEEELRNLFVL